MMFRYLASRGTANIIHVEAHNDDPWNELADSLCKHASTQHTALPYVLRDQAEPHPEIDWAWLRHHEDAPAYPPSTNHGFSITMPCIQYMAQRLVDQSQQEAKWKRFDLSLMQYNVCFMLLGDSLVACDTLQLRVIKKQCRDRGITISAFQETRLPECAMVQDGFLFINAGAADGNYGTALLIDLEAVCG